MDSYIDNYDTFNKIIIYNFENGCGGIGDCIKYFMFVLKSCMESNIRLYYKKNNIILEKYIKLKHDKMYIDEAAIKLLNCYEIVTPFMYYSTFNYDFCNINITDVFYFTDEVKLNYKNIVPTDLTNYISLHLRLGDKYLETDRQYIQCPDDTRGYSDERIHKMIEENDKKSIFFCCDNAAYKLKLKEKYNNIIIANCDIGHTSQSNTTEKQALDAVTEFYILTNSEIIYGASCSGFSIVASKCNNIPYISL
jgi:hypothetical protein